jgi:hypothetical protein
MQRGRKRMPDEDVSKQGEVKETMPMDTVTIPPKNEIWANIFALAAKVLSIPDAGKITLIS